MPHYRCEQCASMVEADAVPERCKICGASADRAFPRAAVSESLLEDEPRNRDDPWNPTARTTLELDDGDLEETPSPPPTPAEPPAEGAADAWNPLSRTTLELAEEDLEIQTAAQPTAPPPTPHAMLEGRVAYPVSADDDEAPASALHEVDDVAVAGLPPTPPRQSGPLASQTESLAKIRGRARSRRWRMFLLVVAAGGGVGGVAGLMSRSYDEPAKRPGGLFDGAAALSPDAAVPPDTAPPDQAAPDRGVDTAPDAARPDQAPPAHRSHQQVAAKPGPRPEQIPPRVRVEPKPKPKPGPRPKMQGPAAKALYAEGLRMLFRGQNDQAIAKFNQALKADRRFSMAFRGLGLAYQKAGRKAMARAAYKRYLLLRPDAPDAARIRDRITSLQ